MIVDMCVSKCNNLECKQHKVNSSITTTRYLIVNTHINDSKSCKNYLTKKYKTPDKYESSNIQ